MGACFHIEGVTCDNCRDAKLGVAQIPTATAPMPFVGQVGFVNLWTPADHRRDLRERAAIAAMQALLGGGSLIASREEVAEAAVRYADALVAELEKESGR